MELTLVSSIAIGLAIVISCFEAGIFLGNAGADAIGKGMERRGERLGLKRSIVHARHFDDLVSGGGDGGVGSGGSDVPNCARGVLLPLRRLEEDGVREEANENAEEDGRRSLLLDPRLGLLKEGGASPNDACVGMLIRDDIILTSRACSEHRFEFDFPGLAGALEAVPHPSLNHRRNDDEDGPRPSSLDPRLGFLFADPPHHHHFLDRPVRRARMFLSLQSKLSAGIVGSGGARDNRTRVIDRHDRGGTAVARCDGARLIAHNFPVDGELVPLGGLVRVLPDDGTVLWEDVDGATAYLSQGRDDASGGTVDRWWTRRIALRQEEETFRALFREYKGPPGSISIPDAHSDFNSRAAALCEAVDPRGHRREWCFTRGSLYRWRHETPFSGRHFFDWLDYGPASAMKDENKYCDKTVHYFDERERRKHEVYIAQSEDGTQLIARYRYDDSLVPESEECDPHLYVWDLNSTLYVVDNTWDHDVLGTIKHTCVLAGRPALSAGTAYFGKGGSIWGINYSSGHYRPGISAVSMMHQWIKDLGLNATALHWAGRSSWSSEKCDRVNWRDIQVPGYDAAALNRSCHEVTTSPTWILKDDV